MEWPYCTAPFVYSSHTTTSGNICQSKFGIFQEHISCYLVVLITCILLYMLSISYMIVLSLFGPHHLFCTCVCVCVCECVFMLVRACVCELCGECSLAGSG